MMDDEDNLDGYEQGDEEKTIVLRVPKPMQPLKAAASIEARLREMQRKLSEIAEIPKILSSTLATVSQTFYKLMPPSAESEQQLTKDAYVSQQQYRKYSYDEDAMDYELSADETDTDDYAAVDDADKKKLQVEPVDKLVTVMKKKKVKDVTPESDYASEVNYKGNETDEDDDDDDDDGDDDVDVDDGDYDCKQQSQAATLDDDEDNENYNDIEEDEADTDDEDEDEDFLSTTYTWNLRNVPKLQLNDEKSEVDTEDDDAVVDADEDTDTDDADDNFTGFTMQKKKLKCKNEREERLKMRTPEQLFKHEKQEKLDKLERSWPWADREKIIYKQSTCHLVRRKPLGLVEQRIQLLAKQNLFDNILNLDRQK